MEKSYYFKPNNTPLAASQVIGQMGFDPDGLNEEILRSYGLFPIRDSMNPQDILENPYPIYKDMGEFYLKCASPDDIELGEAKFKVASSLAVKADISLNNLLRSYSFSSELASFLLQHEGVKSRQISEFLVKQKEIVESLDIKLSEVEKSSSVADLRQILNQ